MRTTFSRFLFYAACITACYITSSFITTTTPSFSELHSACTVHMHAREIFYISLAMGLLSCIDCDIFTVKIRRIFVFSTLCYIFISFYQQMLRYASTTQLNILEILLRRHINVSLILASEFILILVMKSIIFCLAHKIVSNLHYLMAGRRTRNTARTRTIRDYASNTGAYTEQSPKRRRQVTWEN